MARTAKTAAHPRRARGETPAFVTDGVPLYYQLASVLREKILFGQFTVGDRIATEAGLSRDYGVSRITVRQALAELEHEGLIRREAGRGTFVSEHRSFTGALKVEGSLDDLMWMGLTTSVKLLDLTTVKAMPAQARVLQVEPGSPLTRCTRLRSHQQVPFAYITVFIPADVARRLRRADFKKGSIMLILDRLGYKLGDADQTVQAALADANLARHLRTRIGAPLLSVDRVVRTIEGRPIEAIHTYYRTDIYSMNVHLARSGEHGPGELRWSFKSSHDRRQPSGRARR
jgi:GntR family transcriptional regulator